jgi:hypothetical protein
LHRWYGVVETLATGLQEKRLIRTRGLRHKKVVVALQLVAMHHWRWMRFDEKDNGPAEKHGSDVMRAVRTFLLAALMATIGWTSSRAAERVDLLLVLAADVSGSMDESKFDLQRS